MRSALVLGYYNKHNLGDTMFSETIPALLQNFQCDFYLTDFFASSGKQASEYDVVICGGGDIINKYFLDDIELILKDYTGPVYCLGIGITYLSMLTKQYLNLFDYFFIREMVDLPLLSKLIGAKYAHAIPDLAFIKTPRTWQRSKIQNVIESENTKSCIKFSKISSGKTSFSSQNTIGVFLATPMINNTHKFQHTLKIITYIAKFGKIKLIRFNTSNNPKENDQIINDLVYKHLCTTDIDSKYIELDNKVYTSDEMIDLMSNLDLAICGRFHAHIFATISGCPFISLANTRKVELYLQDENLNNLYLGGLDSQNSNYDYETFVDEIWNQRVNISAKLEKISRVNNNRLNITKINTLLVNNEKRPKFNDEVDVEHVYQITRRHIFQLTGYDVANTRNTETNPNISDINANKIAAQMCFNITRCPESRYEWGTRENIKNKPWLLRDMISYINNEHKKTQDMDIRKLDLDYYDQNSCVGLHRAGWQYVLLYLRTLCKTNAPVLCDTFMDRTFIWGRWTLTNAGILPYTSNWIGFIHHPPSLENKNNTLEILNAPEFIQSAKTCKGLICLSKYLANYIRQKLTERELNIPVISIKHPTLFVNKTWRNLKLESSLTKIQLVNIGTWCRNPFSIYKIKVRSDFQKMTLAGPKNNDYIIPAEFKLTSDIILKANNTYNKWIYYFCKDLQSSGNICQDLVITQDDPLISKYKQSVVVIDHLDNDQYDTLLSNCVVFLNLIDASAANTIIECIVRNTPLLVNHHPAVVEYLGTDYPLYYHQLDDIYNILTYERVIHAHKYLVTMDKSDLNIEIFLQTLAESDIYQKL